MKKTLTVLLALVLVFSLVSCAKTAEGGPTAPTAPASSDTASAPPASAGPETAAPESSAPEKEYGGVLKIVNTSEGAAPLGIPWEIYSLDSYLIKPCGEGLVVSKADGEYVGLLATGWTADINEPSVTFELRKGVKFTDGSDFNAEVVKWNCEKAQEANMLDTNIISMEVIDDYTIKFGLEEWSFQILTSFERAIISKEAFEANGIEWARENPVMTGPFKLKQYDHGVKLVYERNENYWQEGKPYLDGVEYHFISDTMTQNAAMQATGDQRVDVLNTTSPEQVLALQGLDVYVLSMDSGSLNLIPNSLDPDSPFNDIRVRQAISYAIDRDAIMAARGFGVMSPANQLLPEGVMGRLPDSYNCTYDLEKAKQLMAEAGYADGFSTAIYCMPGIVDVDIAVAIQSMLEKINVKVAVETPDQGGYSALRFGEWDGMLFQLLRLFPGVINTMALNFDVQDDLTTNWLKSAYRPLEELYNAYQDAARQEAVSDEKLQVCHRLLLENMCCVPVYNISDYYIIRNNVHDTGFTVWSANTVWMPADAWMSQG